MKNLWLVPLFLFIGAGLSAQEQRHLFSEARKEGEVFFLTGETVPYTGVLFSKHENGKTMQEFHLKDGRFTGTGRTWFLDGTLMDETPFNEKGEMEGEAVGFYPSGKVKVKVEYRGGKINGLNTLLWENGKPKTVGTMKNGKWDGLTRTWWENGNQKASTMFKDGENDGPCQEWFENGQQSLDANFSKGNPDGEIRTWHPNGKPESVVVMKDGKLVSEKYWDAKGEVDNNRECLANMKVISAAAAMYEIDHPGTFGKGAAKADVAELARQGYLKSIPSCPDSGTYSIGEGEIVPPIRCSFHGPLPEK